MNYNLRQSREANPPTIAFAIGHLIDRIDVTKENIAYRPVHGHRSPGRCNDTAEALVGAGGNGALIENRRVDWEGSSAEHEGNCWNGIAWDGV